MFGVWLVEGGDKRMCAWCMGAATVLRAKEPEQFLWNKVATAGFVVCVTLTLTLLGPLVL